MKYIVFVILVINIFSQQLFASCSPNNIKKINNYLSSFTNLQSDFEQIDRNNKITNGKFFMKRANYMKLEYNQPAMTILYDKGNVKYYDREINSIRKYKIHNFILRAILDGKIENRNLTCKNIEETGEQFIVYLIAKYDIATSSDLVFYFDKISCDKLSLVSLENRNKNEHVKINFLQNNYDVIDESEFTIK